MPAKSAAADAAVLPLCSIARASQVLADPWALLVLRDCFRGATRFEDFLSLSAVSRTVLADRLKDLVAEGLLTKGAYQQHPPRFDYRLTPAGADALPMLLAFMHWGDTHRDHANGPPVQVRHHGCGRIMPAGAYCSHCRLPVDASSISFEPGPGAKGAEAQRIAKVLAGIRAREGRANASASEQGLRSGTVSYSTVSTPQD